MATIADQVTNVRLKLGNRSDIDARVAGWLVDAYRDLGSNYPFEELEDTINDLLVPNIGEYPYADQVRAVKTLSIQLPNGDTRELKKRHIINIRRYSILSGDDPSIWAPFKRVAHVRPKPRNSYSLIWDVWLKPQISDPVTDTPILLPDDWLEILNFCAAFRGHIDLIERDKAGELRMLLYGDPKHPDNLGLIASKLRQKAAENVAEDYPIRPRIRRYTNVT